MKIEFTFDPKAIEQQGYAVNDVYSTIKKHFAGKGLPCIADGEVLAFGDNGQENDYAYMWNIILRLLKSEWFVAFASSCTFFDDDDIEEDVLSQAWKVQKRMA
jgi:hypothetical protein